MSYQLSGISSIENYAEALKRYETTKHIRGRAEDQRPLGDRKKIDAFRISKEENGNIQCFLYQTPVVTFTPEDNIVIFLDKWVSSSACKFIWELLWRLGIEARVFDDSICVKFSDGGEYRLQSHTPTTLIRAKHPDGEEDTFTLSDWDKRIVHMVDRKGKKEALAPYGPFHEYICAFLKLRAGEGVHKQEIEEALAQGHYPTSDTRRNGRSEFTQRVEYLNKWMLSTMENKHEDFYRASMLLYRGIDHYRDTVRIDMEFYENVLLGVNRDKVFKEVQVTDGKVKKDAYKGFYGDNWNAFHAHDDSQNA
jgi:hypothetical protein